MRQAFDLTFARRFLRGNYLSSALAILALVCGVALVCAMDLVNRAVGSAFMEVVDTMAGRAALSVTAGGAPFPQAIREIINGIPEIEAAVPVVSATAFTTDDSGDLLTVHGVDITDDAAVRLYEEHAAKELGIDDTLEFLNTPDSVILTRQFADSRRLAVGDHIDLITPVGRRTFTVRGLLEPRGIARAYGGNLVVMDLVAAQTIFLQADFITRIDIVLSRDARLDSVIASLQSRLPNGLRIERPEQRKADLNRIMESLRVMLFALSLIALAAAFLIILNRLTTLFETRLWQFGILRSVGMRSTTLSLQLVKEALILGIIGVTLGIPLGILVGRLLLPAVAATAALNFKFVATSTHIAIRPLSLAIAAFLGIGTAVIAAAIPASRLARCPPIEAIRGRGLSPLSPGTVGRRALVIVIAAIAATIVGQIYTRNPLWGFAATGLIVIATALAARPFLTVVSQSLFQGLRLVVGPSISLASGTFTRNAGRAVLTVSMIAVGMGAVIWLRTLAYSFENSLVDALSQALRGDLILSSAHVSQGYLEAPLNDAITSHLRSLDGVASVAAERITDWHYADGPIAIDAFDPVYFEDARFGRWPLVGGHASDLWRAVQTGQAVIVSSSFAVNLRAAPGDWITLDTPNGPLSTQIAAVTLNFSSPRGTIIMSRELFARFWNDSLVTRVFIQTDPARAVSAVRKTIATELGNRYGVKLILPADLVSYFASQVRRAFSPLDILAALLLFVLLVGLADTLFASVIERTRELAITRTLGGRRRLVRTAVVAEAICLGLPGLALALVSGVALSILWVHETFPLLLGWGLEIYFPAQQILAIAAMTILVCWVAGLVPGWRAAAMIPANALRYE